MSSAASAEPSRDASGTISEYSDGTHGGAQDPTLVALREEMAIDEWGGIPAQYDWSKKTQSWMCACFGFCLQCVLIATCGSFLFGFNLSLLNTSVNYIAWDLEWCGDSQTFDDCNTYTIYTSFIQVAVFIGAAIGSMTGGGFLAYGRRTMLLMSMWVFVIGIISSVCANSFSALLWARLIVGYGVGVVSVCAPTWMSEVTPKDKRGKFGVLHQLFVTVGIFVAVLLGLPMALTSPMDMSKSLTGLGDLPMFCQVWWRVMLGIGILPVLLCFYLFMGPYTFDTPNYYVEKKQFADAEELLRKLYESEDVRDVLVEIRDEIQNAETMRANGLSLSKACGDPTYRWVIIYGCLLSAFQQLGGINVFIASSSALFSQAGLNLTDSTWATVGMDLLNVVMTFPAVPLIERMGRRTLMVIGTAVMFCGVVPGAICYWIDPNAHYTMYLALVGCFVFIIGFASTYGPILWVYLFEIYPSEIKGAAAGLATAFNWLAGIIMVFVCAYLTNQINYTIFAVMSALAFVIVFLWMKETKGRALGDSPFMTKE